MLFSARLTRQEMSDILTVVAKIGEDPVFAPRFRKEFKKFAAGFSDPDYSGKKLSQMLWKAFSAKMQNNMAFCMMAYDFFVAQVDNPKGMEALRDAARESPMPNKDQRRLFKTMYEVRTAVEARLRERENPFTTLARELSVEDVDPNIPPEFFKLFCGFRRSSNNQDIIRFSYHIKPSPSRNGFVTYTNRYRRGHKEWVVRGGGIYSTDKTMYLFGHARDSEGQETRGYRTQALRVVPGTEFLSGPVISKDGEGPIAARILLIPMKRLKRNIHNHDKTEAEVIADMIQLPEPGDKDRYVDEINFQVSSLFGHKRLYGLLEYISNATTTAIKCVPDFGEEDYQRLLRYDTLLRALCHRNNWEYGEKLSRTMEELYINLENRAPFKNRFDY